MADLTRGRRPADARQALIRKRRSEHECNAMRVSRDKFEIDILEAEVNIERLRESIDAINERIIQKESELAAASAEEGE